MRGKCETCEFFWPRTEDTGMLGHGTCRIRSVEDWPARFHEEGCGEYSSNAPRMEGQSYQPPEPHQATRVERSMEPLYPMPERVEEPS